MKIKTLEKLIDHAGGTGRIATALGLHQSSVECWHRLTDGIPHKHWDKLISFFGVSAEELHVINLGIYANQRKQTR